MEREEYFQLMRETSEVIDVIIEEAIQTLRSINEELYNFIISIPAFKKRLDKKEKLRPFLLRLAYGLVGGNNWKKVAYACAAVELLNISTYIDNAVFDNKNNISEKDKTNYIISARIIRNLAEDILKKANKKHFEKLNDLLRQIDSDIYAAQFQDANQVKSNMVLERIDLFISLYLKRCEGLTGRFLENICKMGAILGGGIEEQISDLGEIGKNIGIMVQIINDIGDFVPSEEGVYDYEKVYQDQFSDMKNGKITLPVYYLLQFGSDKEKEIINSVLNNKSPKNRNLISVARVLVESGAIDFSKDLAKKYAKNVQILLRNFENSDLKSYLIIMSKMCSTNKYLAGLKDKFGVSKKKKEYVVLVNENDKPIGIEEKFKVHIEGQLHRAFSIFIFNSRGELLIQKRANSKYHSGGLWSNTCCSHPRADESVLNAAHRRLKEEMGLNCSLREVFNFYYGESFENGLIENEIDHVLIGECNEKPKINKDEISDFKWIKIDSLKKDMKNNPQNYTAWFKIALKKYLELKSRGGLK